MHMLNWIRRCLATASASRQASRIRLAVEGLEDRTTPATITVTGSGDLIANNTNVSLREAITAINNQADFSDVVAVGAYGNNDTIVFPPAAVGGTVALTGALPDLTRSVNIQGPQGSGGVTIQGQAGGNFRLLKVGDSASGANVTVNIAGLTFSGGSDLSGVGGGAILVDVGSTLTLIGYTFTGNTTTVNGGAIYNAGTLNLQYGGFDNNTALSGSGGAIYNAGTLNMLDSNIVTGNQATLGGALFNAGTAALERVILSANTATLRGGGILNNNSGNTVVLLLTNVIVSNNNAQLSGGGLYNQAGGAILTNVTFTANRADSDGTGNGSGGGINRNGGTVTLINSLIAGNLTNQTPDDLQGAVASGSSFNLLGVAANTTLQHGVNNNQVGTAVAPIDARITTTTNNSLIPGATFYVLQADSPALDAGSNALAVDPQGQPLLTDMPGPFGSPRVLDGNGDGVAVVDIGALEAPARPVPLAPPIVAPQVAALVLPQIVSVGLGRVRRKLGQFAVTVAFDSLMNVTPSSFWLLRRKKGRLKFRLTTTQVGGRTIATLTFTGARRDLGQLMVLGGTATINGLPLGGDWLRMF